jgi:hypothetical protein
VRGEKGHLIPRCVHRASDVPALALHHQHIAIVEVALDLQLQRAWDEVHHYVR